MSGDPIRDVITIVLLSIGALMSLAAAIGLARWPDVLTRLHAGAKPQVLGVVCAVAAVAVQVPTVPVICTSVLVIVFQMLTQPVSAHMVGRSAYRADEFDREALIVDELEDDIAHAELDAAEEAHEPFRQGEPDPR